MNKKIILIVIIFFGMFSSCTKNFEDLNIDPKHPLEVNGSVLFTNAQVEIADQISSTNVNRNIWKLMAQYWTERSYTDEANWNIVNRRISDNMFQTYMAILKDLKDAKEIIGNEEAFFDNEKANQKNRIAIIDLTEVFVWQRLVDMFGDIPYSESLDIENYTPKYDDAATIYQDLITRATADAEAIDITEGSFGSADLIYGGDTDSWQKFAYSLLVKLGIGIADGPLSALGQSTVEGAYDKVFTSSADDALFPYQASLPYVNPLYTDLVASGRHDFLIATTIFHAMDSISDPRINYYFEDITNPTTDYGYSGGSYSSKMHYNSVISAPDYKGFFMTYDEVQFYLAEAAARTWSVGQTADVYFDNGVTASILSWGGTDAEATALLTAHPYASYIGGWKDAIGTQAWISMYTRGFIGYTFFRRLDFPEFSMPPSPPEGVTTIPTRFTYPINEQTLNAANYQAAATAIGGDKLTTPLFWDIN